MVLMAFIDATSPTVMVTPFGAMKTVFPSALSAMLWANMLLGAWILPFNAPLCASMTYQKSFRSEPTTSVLPSGVTSGRSQQGPS